MDKSNLKRKHVGAYEVGHTLGQGAFGKVKLGTNIFTGEKVAIKVIAHGSVRTPKEIQQLERERTILLKLKHPNIVNLIKVVDDNVRNKCYMIFEYVNGGELFDYIVNHGRLSEIDARKFMRQIISAVEYCHSLLVIHRDLKPENLLLDDKLNIKITDFGLSNIMEPGKKFSTFCGSLHYACPEILQGKEYLGPGVDIWAMGIILYCLVVGRQPWDGANAEELISSILEDGLEIPENISDECVNLILAMLRVKEDDRIPLSAMRHHPWIMEGYLEPPESFLPKFEPISKIDQSILDQMQLMGLISADNVDALCTALKNGDKENQGVCIYNLLANERLQKSPKAKRSKSSKEKKDSLPEDGSTDQRRFRSRSVSSGKKVVTPSSPPIPVPSTGTSNKRPSEAQSASAPPTPKVSPKKEDEPSRHDSRDSLKKSRKKIVVSTPQLSLLNSSKQSSSPTPDNGSPLNASSLGAVYSVPSSPHTTPLGSPLASPKKASRLASSDTASKARSRSASAAPKLRKPELPPTPEPRAEPRAVSPDRPIERAVSPKRERPVLSLADISSGKLKNTSPSKPQKIPTNTRSNPSSPSRRNLDDIFKPPTDDEKSIPSELKTKLFSRLPHPVLRQEIVRVLNLQSLTVKERGDSKFKCSTYVDGNYITFSVEIINLSDKSLLGVKIKRLGDRKSVV